MERLTEKGNYSTYTRKNHVTVNDVEQRLGEYEYLEEEGLLLRLPCKIGADVYYIFGIPSKMQCEIESCAFELSDINNIGKRLFLTREEAEQKLKELTSQTEC